MNNTCPYKGFAEGRYTLPALPYDVTAMEPFLDAETLTLHHDRNHAAYVEGANNAAHILQLVAAGELEESAASVAAQQLAFHLGGHILHSLYWRSISPQQGQQPAGALAPNSLICPSNHGGEMSDACCTTPFTAMESHHHTFSSKPLRMLLIPSFFHKLCMGNHDRLPSGIFGTREAFYSFVGVFQFVNAGCVVSTACGEIFAVGGEGYAVDITVVLDSENDVACSNVGDADGSVQAGCGKILAVGGECYAQDHAEVLGFANGVACGNVGDEGGVFIIV